MQIAIGFHKEPVYGGKYSREKSVKSTKVGHRCDQLRPYSLMDFTFVRKHKSLVINTILETVEPIFVLEVTKSFKVYITILSVDEVHVFGLSLIGPDNRVINNQFYFGEKQEIDLVSPIMIGWININWPKIVVINLLSGWKIILLTFHDRTVVPKFCIDACLLIN